MIFLLNKIAFKALLVLSALSLSSFYAKGQEWIKREPTSTIDLITEEDTISVSIKLIVDPEVKFSDVTVESRPGSVRYNTRSDEKFYDAITTTKAKGKTPAITLNFNLKLLSEPGVYEVTVVFCHPSAGCKEVVLSLNRPSAKLESVSPVSIHIEGNEITRKDPLSFQESGKLSNARNVSLTSPEFTGVKIKDIIEFESPYVTILAGKRTRVGYDLFPNAIDDLPLGETKGKMYISSTELTVPTTVEFTITNKRHKAWIMLCILLGAGLGLAVRKLIIPAQATSASRINGLLLVEAVSNKIKASADPQLKESLRTAILELNETLTQSEHSVGSGLAEKIDKAVADARTKINALLAAFEQDKSDVKTQIEKLASLFAHSSTVLKTSLYGAANKDVDEARNFFIISNISGAKAKANAASDLLKQSIKQVHENSKAFNTIMKANSLYPTFILNEAKEIFKQLESEMQTKIEGFIQPTTVDETIKAYISGDEIYRNMVLIIENLVSIVNKQVEKVADADLTAKTSTWALTLRGNTAAQFANSLNFFHLVQSKKEMEDRWNQLNQVARQPAQAGADYAGPAKAMTFKEWADELEPSTPLPTPPAEQPVAEQKRKSKQQLQIWTALNVLITLLLMSIAAYGVYAPKFIGHLEEMIEIFVFAFGLDVALQSIQTISAKSLRG
jgi:hypothetical protein